MKISTKLYLSVGIIAIVLISLAINFYVIVQRVDKLVEEVKELPELQAKLGTLTIQHYQWVEALGVGTMLMGKEFTKAKDPTKCDLGKWYYSFTSPEQLKEAYLKIEEPHKKIHATAEKIISAVQNGDLNLAKQIYQEETLPNLESTRNALTEMRLEIKNMVDANILNILDNVIFMEKIIIYSFGILILFTFGFFYFFLIKPLRKNFNQLIGVANSVARGDFSSIR